MKTPEEVKKDKDRLELADRLAAEYFDILMDDISIKYHTGWYNDKYSYARTPIEIADEMMVSECMDMADDYRYRIHNERVSQDTREILEQNNLDIQAESEDFKLIYNKLLEARIQVCFNVTALLSDKAMPFKNKVERLPSEIIQESQIFDPIFPTPEGVTWEEVTFRITDEQKAIIQVEDQKVKYGYKKMGFSSKINNKPITAWHTLVSLAENKGTFTWQSNVDNQLANKMKKRISELRKALIRLMGINDDPFHKWSSKGGYRLKAKILDKRTSEKLNNTVKDSLYWDNVASGRIEY